METEKRQGKPNAQMVALICSNQRKSNDIRGFAVPPICVADRQTYGEQVVNVWQEEKL